MGSGLGSQGCEPNLSSQPSSTVGSHQDSCYLIKIRTFSSEIGVVTEGTRILMRSNGYRGLRTQIWFAALRTCPASFWNWLSDWQSAAKRVGRIHRVRQPLPLSLSLAMGMGMGAASSSLPRSLPSLRLRLIRLTRLRVRACADPTPPPVTQTKTDSPLHLSTTSTSPLASDTSTHTANSNLPPTTSGNGGVGNTGNGNGKDHGDDRDDNGMSDDEFGPLLSFQEVMQEAEARGLKLPADMLHAAQNGGIQKLLLLRYIEMQASAWPLGDAVRSIPLLRNRMLADPSFLFKVGTEIIIDSCCATVAEVQKRGKDFWSEFELYAADLLVGVVVNVALVGMLAPYARFGHASTLKQPGLLARLRHAYDALPSSVFEAERPGCRFTVQQRVGTYFYKGVLYGVVGFGCGLVGQGIANLIMTAKRSVKKSDEDVPVPPLFKSAVLWGAFLAVSSNTRYQIINGLERLVEASPVARQIPPVALAFTVGVRFANNIYGGMQFVDWARLTGCQ